VPFGDARERAQRAFSLDDQPHISAFCILRTFG
jgi:hypothetical protein